MTKYERASHGLFDSSERALERSLKRSATTNRATRRSPYTSDTVGTSSDLDRAPRPCRTALEPGSRSPCPVIISKNGILIIVRRISSFIRNDQCVTQPRDGQLIKINRVSIPVIPNVIKHRLVCSQNVGR